MQKQSVSGPKDPNAIRTIVIHGLPETVDQKALWMKVCKCDGRNLRKWRREKKALVRPYSDIYFRRSITYITAYAMFSTSRAASQAVEKLYAHVFKGSILPVMLKKRVEGLTKVKSGVKTTTIAPSRGSRLIVRNLLWNVSIIFS